MQIVKEVSFEENSIEHQKNVCQIESEINKLLVNKFHSCAYLVNSVIITNDILKIKEKYGYDLNPHAYATTHKNGKMYDVIINYNNAIYFLGEKCILQIYCKNHIYHEFQHIRDHKKYDEFIDRYAFENNLDYNHKEIGKLFFFEFDAAYKAQLYQSIEWECNKYSLDTNIEKYNHRFAFIKEKIDEFNLRDIEKSKIDYVEILEIVINFIRDLIYDFAIAFGTNAADNKKMNNRKIIDITVDGIDSVIDASLNSFISEVNSIIDSNEKIIKYVCSNCMDYLFNPINDIFKKKLKELEFNM